MLENFPLNYDKKKQKQRTSGYNRFQSIKTNNVEYLTNPMDWSIINA